MEIRHGFVSVPNEKVIQQDSIQLYVDGASRITNGQITPDTLGAYSYYLSFKGHEKSQAVVTLGKTNNFNEIKALSHGLSMIKNREVPIIAYSDSAYVVDCIQKGWYKTWRDNGWDKKGGLKNADEWKELISIIESFKNFKIQKVKGHADNAGNNTVDFLNNESMDKYLRGEKVNIFSEEVYE